MARIEGIETSQADPAAKELLAAAEKRMGRVPNLLKGLAHSPTALRAYVTLSGVLADGELSPRLREQIAVATAGVNGCQYCASAHTAIGKSLAIDGEELGRNLAGEASDARTAAVLSFVRNVVEKRGLVDDAELEAVREAGFTDGDVAEIVAHIALNTLTNHFNGVARTELDFPRVEVGAASPG